MKGTHKIIAGLLFGMIGSTSQAAMPDVLKQYYGNYNSALKCYTYVDKNNQENYCMKVVLNKEVSTPAGKMLYVITSGQTYDKSTNELVSYHVSGGNNGLFVFKEQNNQYKLLASDKDLSLSSFGTGAEEWTMHEFGPNIWGVMTETGDSHGGISGSRYMILVPQNGKIMTSDIGSNYSDADTGKDCGKNNSKCTSIEASIKIDRSSVVNGFYPINMTVNGNDGKTKYNNRVYKVIYDKKKGFVSSKNYPLANLDY